jgi:hypothetical protein
MESVSSMTETSSTWGGEQREKGISWLCQFVFGPFVVVGKKMETWNKQEVADFLAEVGHADLSEGFMENDIDGQLLAILDDDALLELGVSDATKRKDLLGVRDFFDENKQAALADKDVSARIQGLLVGSNAPAPAPAPVAAKEPAPAVKRNG